MPEVQALVRLTFCGHCGSRMGVGRESNSCILVWHGNHNHKDDILALHSHNEALKALVQALQMLVVLALVLLTFCHGGGCRSHNHTQGTLECTCMGVLVRGTPLGGRKVHDIHDGRHIPARDPHLASPRWKRKRIPPGTKSPRTSWLELQLQ